MPIFTAKELSEAMASITQRRKSVNTAKSKPLSGSESSNAMVAFKTGMQSVWEAKPTGFMGYFGRYSKMTRGQKLALLKEARSGFFMVAPVDAMSRICGRPRAVKRFNIAAIQPDFFVIA